MTKSKLRETLTALAQGAAGHCTVDFYEGEDNPCGLLANMGLDTWFTFIAAAQRMLVKDQEVVCPVAFELYNLYHFETIGQATEHLWRHRAG